MCTHFCHLFLVLFFVSLKIYIFRLFVFFFCCWFFLLIIFFCDTFTQGQKVLPFGGNNNTPLPTTTRSSTWATNSTNAPRVQVRDPSSPSPCFFVRERARALLFFVNATTRCPPLSQRECYITIAKDSHKEIFVSSFEIARCN